MSDFEFAIPRRKEELFEERDGQYCVEDVVVPKLILSKLEDAKKTYDSDGLEYILENFDVYFSIIIHGKKLEWNLINKGYDHMFHSVKCLLTHLKELFKSQEIGIDMRIKKLNILKMLLYLFIKIINVKDAKLAADISKSLNVFKKQKRRTDKEFCNWEESDREAALIMLHSLLQQPLSRLWDPPLADDNFVLLISEPCYNAIEDQIIKNKTVRETIFQILGVLLKKYNHGPSCIVKLVQILQTKEHTVSPICDGVVQLIKIDGLRTFGTQMVQEVVEALATTSEEVVSAAIEHAFARNCSTFLLQLTKELPKEMISPISTLQSYLETDESPSLRVSILSMECEVLLIELHGESLTEEERAQRDDFFDDLYLHMHDISVYVRNKVLQCWSKLQRENCIPVARQHAVLERAIDRLKDKAVLVRKAALQLLRIFIECNPFSAQLKLDILEQQFEEEARMLENIQEQLNPEPDPELITRWEEIENEVIDTVNREINTLREDELDLTQESLQNLYNAIRIHVTNGDYYNAFLTVKYAQSQYPEARLLWIEREESNMIIYFIALIRNVFITPNLSSADDTELLKRYEEKEGVVAFLQESLSFVHLISEAMPIVNKLLRSKQSSDVCEAVELFATAHCFNIEAAQMGISSMLLLMWSSDQEREVVEKAYRRLYFECDHRTDRDRAYTAASRLVTLVSRIDCKGALSFEKLVEKWTQEGVITPSIILVFWEIHLKKINGTRDDHSYAALMLLAMVAKTKPSVAQANIEIIVSHGLTGDYTTRHLSAQLLLTLKKEKKRYSPNDALVKAVQTSLLECFMKLSDFALFASNAIDVIYAICDMPHVVVNDILADMYSYTESKRTPVKRDETTKSFSWPTELMGRFIFALGHVALQQLIYLDVTVCSELRRRNQVREERKEEKKRQKKGGPGRVEELRRSSLMNASVSSACSRLRRLSSTQSSIREEETGQETAVADDADVEYIRNVCENDIVGPGTALGQYIPLLRHLLQTPCSPDLQTVAALTYARFMLVSSSVCEEGLQLIVTILKKSNNVPMRTNLMVAFADLTLRFPNLTQPWTHHIYDLLRDEELDTRKCALKMLTFLLQNEMVRPKQHIADIALCCADEDPEVATMTKAFFKKLSLKGNSLYNVMTDIISRLSQSELNVPEDKYRIIMKYIVSLIPKNRQMEALVEKLCQKFSMSREERQWRDLAYCLSLFKYDVRSIQKLIENIDCFKDKLHCEGIMESFNVIRNKSAKMARTEMKYLVSELSDKIEECFAVRDRGAGDDDEASAITQLRDVPATPMHHKGRPRARRTRGQSSRSFEIEQVSGETSQSVRRSSRLRARSGANYRTLNDKDEYDEVSRNRLRKDEKLDIKK